MKYIINPFDRLKEIIKTSEPTHILLSKGELIISKDEMIKVIDEQITELNKVKNTICNCKKYIMRNYYDSKKKN